MERGKPKLAFLAGHRNGDVIMVSHLVIPTQHEFRPDSEFGKYSFEILAPGINTYTDIGTNNPGI